LGSRSASVFSKITAKTAKLGGTYGYTIFCTAGSSIIFSIVSMDSIGPELPITESVEESIQINQEN
jgi:hypothetical protein